jgi:hypothetical protein
MLLQPLNPRNLATVLIIAVIFSNKLNRLVLVMIAKMSGKQGIFSWCSIFLTFGLVAFSASQVQAQIRIPGIQLPDLPQIDIKIPGIENLLTKEEAVTTSINDVSGEIPFLDSYSPTNFFPLAYRQVEDQGSWLLKSGFYSADLESYCLHAGTYGPSRGEGYLYAPLKGKRASIIRKILLNSVNHPEIPQQDIQSFIWSVEARAKFDTMAPNLKAVGQTLLSSGEIFDLNGGALGLIPADQQDRLFGNVNAVLRPVLEAENKIRGLVTKIDFSYAEIEKYAVLSGDPPPNPTIRQVPRGRWNYHTDGFFVRYLPSGYRRTHVEVYVPERYLINRDEKGRIVMLATADSLLEIKYQDNPIVNNAKGALAAYAFDTIRFSTSDDTSPKLVRTQEWRNVGWTFIGAVTDKKLQSNIALSGVQARLESSRMLLNQLNDFKNHLKSLHKEEWASEKDIIDLAHLRMGIAEIFPNNQESMLMQSHLLERTWQSAFHSWVSGTSSNSDKQLMKLAIDQTKSQPVLASTDTQTAIQIGGHVAVPVDTSRQRLGISSRVISPSGLYKLTIYVQNPGFSPSYKGFGHAWISLSDGQTTSYYGFYPSLRSSIELPYEVLPIGTAGTFIDDRGRHYDVMKEYTITQQGLRDAYQAIVDWNDNYNLTDHNCATFASKIGIASGALPSKDVGIFASINPASLANYLLSHGGVSKTR